MNPSLAKPIFYVVLLLAGLACSPALHAQSPASGSSARNAPVDQSAEAFVQQLIAKSESHFRQGLLNLKEKRQAEARDEFDKAVDVIYESGLDVRSYPKLQKFFVDLVESIYRLEAPDVRGPQVSPVIAANYGLDGTEKLDLLDQGNENYEVGNLEVIADLAPEGEETKVTQEQIQQVQEAANVVAASTGVNFELNPLIVQFINYYQGRGRQTMYDGLYKSGQFIDMAKRIFREEGVPEDIAWLGQVESAWKVRARSWASAVGLWSFIPGTGARYGLRQNAWIDERSTYEKATRASARYLRFLASRYNGNWELAMAAYNTGEGNIDRAIKRAGVASFWAIYPYLTPATRNYMPNILAVIFIAKNPDRFGFGNVPRLPPLRYDTVEVPGSVSFQLVAAATGADVDGIRYLNPEIKRDRTPPGENYRLNIPAGRSNQFIAVLRRIPVNMRDSIASIAMTAPGETLEQFATRNKLNVDALRQVNYGVGADQQAGFVIVPNRARVVDPSYGKRPGSTAAPAANLKAVRIGADISLEAFAAQQGFSVQELVGINGFPAGTILKKGQMINVPATAAPRR